MMGAVAILFSGSVLVMAGLGLAVVVALQGAAAFGLLVLAIGLVSLVALVLMFASDGFKASREAARDLERRSRRQP